MSPRLTALAVAILAAVCACAVPARAEAALHLSEIGSFDQPVYVTAPPSKLS